MLYDDDDNGCGRDNSCGVAPVVAIIVAATLFALGFKFGQHGERARAQSANAGAWVGSDFVYLSPVDGPGQTPVRPR